MTGPASPMENSSRQDRKFNRTSRRAHYKMRGYMPSYSPKSRVISAILKWPQSIFALCTPVKCHCSSSSPSSRCLPPRARGSHTSPATISAAISQRIALASSDAGEHLHRYSSRRRVGRGVAGVNRRKSQIGGVSSRARECPDISAPASGTSARLKNSDIEAMSATTRNAGQKSAATMLPWPCRSLDICSA